MEDRRIQELLDHIDQMHIVSARDMRLHELDALTRLGYIHRVWIGTYALTPAGQAARKQGLTRPQVG